MPEKATIAVIFDAVWNSCIRAIEGGDYNSSFRMASKILELSKKDYKCKDTVLLFSFVTLHAFWNMEDVLGSDDMNMIESILSILIQSSKDVGSSMGRMSKRMRLEKGGRRGFSSDTSIFDAVEQMIQKSKIVLCILRNECSELEILTSVYLH